MRPPCFTGPGPGQGSQTACGLRPGHSAAAGLRLSLHARPWFPLLNNGGALGSPRHLPVSPRRREPMQRGRWTVPAAPGSSGPAGQAWPGALRTAEVGGGRGALSPGNSPQAQVSGIGSSPPPCPSAPAPGSCPGPAAQQRTPQPAAAKPESCPGPPSESPSPSLQEGRGSGPCSGSPAEAGLAGIRGPQREVTGPCGLSGSG